ncbi:long-chain acyl-CoA synthetase [Nonomuraea maritima]|uniref:Long-chain acyl-CoA synthetase n=1 Tax=Nonomuraea maritima TaxID=683260 RepID=A0A1G9EZB9_9ACTN|nr:AMP-binding protein [Nonomuraea maritima]SDK81470.1 long-chain acyl-CoA synthetase [Nonomuraea maritima]
MPVVPHVLRHAVEQPSKLAVCGPGGELTYAELARKINGAARHLRDQGVGPSSLVAVGPADPVEFIATALAADLAGATPVVGDPSWSHERWSQVSGPAGPLTFLGESLPYAAGPEVRRKTGPDDLAWACFSSGSTGRPRAIVRRRASWTASFPHLSDLAGIGADDVVLVPGPLASSLYSFAAMHTLAAGATALVPGRPPTRAALASYVSRATVVHVVPGQLADMLGHPGSRLRAAVVGGAALDPGVRAAAARAGVHTLAYYGATELSFVAVDVDGDGLRPFPGVEIEVRPEPGSALGAVWVRSPWLAEGYLGGAAGPLRRDPDGWATVGDVAEPYRLGEVLRVRGRGDGAIQTGGATVVPEDVEAVLRQVPGVGDVVVVGSPHPSLGAVVTAVVEGVPSRALLEATARNGLDAAQRPRLWYAVPSLPRTPTGKPARALLAARLASGDPGIRRLN